MLSKEILLKFSQVDIKTTPLNELNDIMDVKIKPNWPVAERIEHYLNQVKNPYCFLCGDIKVKVSYLNNKQTLDEALVRYYSNLKN